ncbi:hypothetical protein JM93_03031 [Roseibium hamelinense]|uniref:Uncharacterized protein n=1 Tax=Roseibium hamelinense TaxID=150831 RepID=A0A562STP7_9HYPH|nr:hypothetical protein [Roseibium hamelinense]MTI42417.1 hypothetical protein [Roseibium hamelinense]TWI84697.1 hypothetical protein JM93_03031 [Roseibium hamelinense]
MVRLRKPLASPQDFAEAIKGYEHYPPELIYKFLLEHYVVDLDMLAAFSRHLKTLEATRLAQQAELTAATDTRIVA